MKVEDFDALEHKLIKFRKNDQEIFQNYGDDY